LKKEDIAFGAMNNNRLDKRHKIPRERRSRPGEKQNISWLIWKAMSKGRGKKEKVWN